MGIGKAGCPLITVLEKGRPICYRLPGELGDWAYTVVGMADMGENLFPAQVMFSNIDGKYYADLL